MVIAIPELYMFLINIDVSSYPPVMAIIFSTDFTF